MTRWTIKKYHDGWYLENGRFSIGLGNLTAHQANAIANAHNAESK